VARVAATLYAVHTSHSAHAARLMLEHKGIEHKVVKVAWYFAHKVGANDTEGVRRTVGTLPALLDHVEELLGEGTIGGEQRNAADFQIGTSVRLLMTFEDLAPVMEGRKAARFAAELMPDYPTGIPAGFVPQEWLEPLRG
jgi:glutathione S-transferase